MLHIIRFDVHAGEMLYLPALWYHRVTQVPAAFDLYCIVELGEQYALFVATLGSLFPHRSATQNTCLFHSTRRKASPSLLTTGTTWTTGLITSTTTFCRTSRMGSVSRRGLTNEWQGKTHILFASTCFAVEKEYAKKKDNKIFVDPSYADFVADFADIPDTDVRVV